MLEGKVIVVTGGAAGIGFGISSQVAQKGAAVIIADINAEQGQAAVEKLNEQGYTSDYERVDVSDGASVQTLIDNVLSKYGKIDVLINNAGVTTFRPLLEMSSEDWDHVMNVDLKGVFFTSKAVLPSMLERKKGVIINIASNHALATLPDTEAYAAAKSGVVGFTKSLGLSYGRQGIRVVALAPGFTVTPHIERWLSSSPDPDKLKAYTDNLHPAGRMAQPDDIGRVAAFLASDDAAWITSTTVVADGGLSSVLYQEMEG